MCIIWRHTEQSKTPIFQCMSVARQTIDMQQSVGTQQAHIRKPYISRHTYTCGTGQTEQTEEWRHKPDEGKIIGTLTKADKDLWLSTYSSSASARAVTELGLQYTGLKPRNTTPSTWRSPVGHTFQASMHRQTQLPIEKVMEGTKTGTLTHTQKGEKDREGKRPTLTEQLKEHSKLGGFKFRI